MDMYMYICTCIVCSTYVDGYIHTEIQNNTISVRSHYTGVSMTLPHNLPVVTMETAHFCNVPVDHIQYVHVRMFLCFVHYALCYRVYTCTVYLPTCTCTCILCIMLKVPWYNVRTVHMPPYTGVHCIHGH